MTKNMGTADRVIRTLVAISLGVLVLTGRISGTLAIVLGAFAVILLVTSLFGWCPLYRPFGISSRRP